MSIISQLWMNIYEAMREYIAHQLCVSYTVTEMHMEHSEQCRKFSCPPTRQNPL